METRNQKIDRQRITQRILLLRLQNIYCLAIQLKLTSEHISDQVCKMVFHSAEAKTITKSQLEYLHGYHEAKRHEIYQHCLIWMLHLDGELMTSHVVHALAQYEESTAFGRPNHISPWNRVNMDLCRHVWRDNKGNPILNKPFDAKFLEKKEETKCMTL